MGSFTTLTSADGFSLAAYRAEPEGPVRGGVVVIQEIFGVNPHIQSVADRYAAAGYLAIAPALFDRVQSDVSLTVFTQALRNRLDGTTLSDHNISELYAVYRAMRIAKQRGRDSIWQ